MPAREGEKTGGKSNAEERSATETAGTLTLLTHVVDRQDGGPAGGACALQGHMDDAVGGLDAVLLEGETLITHPRRKTHTVILQRGRNMHMKLINMREKMSK